MLCSIPDCLKQSFPGPKHQNYATKTKHSLPYTAQALSHAKCQNQNNASLKIMCTKYPDVSGIPQSCSILLPETNISRYTIITYYKMKFYLFVIIMCHQLGRNLTCKAHTIPKPQDFHQSYLLVIFTALGNLMKKALSLTDSIP